jgi:hypothetical protein
MVTALLEATVSKLTSGSLKLQILGGLVTKCWRRRPWQLPFGMPLTKAYVGTLDLRADCIASSGWVLVEMRVKNGSIGIGITNHVNGVTS